MVEVRGLARSYGHVPVLRDIDFDLASGSMTTLTGRSGSGKSTLFKLLAALDRPDRGTIRIDGTDIAALDDEAASQMRLRTIGLVFQSSNLLPDLTVRENVRLPLDIAGVPRATAESRAADLLRLVDLKAHAEKRPNLLSGGEAQRAAIARGLANEPRILLADEPTGSLDRANADNVLDLFESVNALGTTVLIISHDPIVTERIPLRIHLEDGRITHARPPIGRGLRP